MYRKWDCIWFLTKTLKPENTTNVTPTWAGYNSLVTKDFSEITLRPQHDDLIEKVREEKIFRSFQQFKDRLNNQPRFLNSYVKMDEVLLLFTRPTCQGNWNLHLSSLELMIPYFFVHHLQNYARFMPVYMAQMHALKESDPTIWQSFHDGSFSVNKSSCAFSATGGDHGIEKENRSLKVLGGVRGILLNKASLHRFSLASQELNRTCDDFLERNNVLHYGQKLHHRLSGSINPRIIANVNKLSDTMEALDVLLRDSDTVYNVVSKGILSEQAKADILNHNSHLKSDMKSIYQ